MANPSILGAYKVVHDDGDVLVVVGATTPQEFRAAVVDAGLVRMHAHEEGTEHDQPLAAWAAMRAADEGGYVWDLDVEKEIPGARPAMVANAYWVEADSFDAPKPPDSLHAHLLHMLGAKDHADAGRIIAQHHVRELATGPLVQLAQSRAGTVYVSGPMTGYEDWNFPAFNAAAAALRAQGFKVINPADHGVVEGADWADYLRLDLAQLSQCEAIYLLPGWSKSKGARLEAHVAAELGMRIMFADGAELAAVQYGVPDGFVLMPKRATADMQQVMDTDGWLWEDLLAAACAITEKEYAELYAHSTQQGLDAQQLHNEIMNLPVNRGAMAEMDINMRVAYKEGHRDARHAAAALVLAAQAKQGVQANG